jgi:molybdopterin converting factor subunit 1
MEIKVKYFGSIAEETGKAEETIALQNGISEVKEFIAFIFKKYGLIDEGTVQVAVNQVIQNEGRIQYGDEVAFLPPYAGG